MSSSVEIFRRELEKWRYLFKLDDIWTFKVDVDKSDSDKMSVSVDYATCSSQYELNDNCPLDEMDLDMMAFKQAICMLVSHIILSEMNDEEDADAAFHKAMLRTSDALIHVLGLSVISGYENLKQTVKEVVEGRMDATQGLTSERAGHA